MGTRSLVGAETESGTKLVYVHWDGYPEGRLPVLHEFIKRHGLDKTIATILETTSGWSSLDPDHEPELREFARTGQFEIVQGFGERYTLTPITLGDEEGYIQGNLEYATPENALKWDSEYVYVFTADRQSIKWAPTWTDGGQVLTWDALDWQVEPIIIDAEVVDETPAIEAREVI